MNINFIDKYKRISIQAKAAIWFTFCNVLQKGISMITIPIFTRILNTDEYGLFSYYLSWLNILTVFTSLNLYYGVFNNAMLKYENDRDRFISSMQGLISVATCTCFCIYFFTRNIINNWIGLGTTLMVLMFTEMLVEPALQFYSAKRKFNYQYKIVVLITLLKSILNPILGIIAILLFPSDKVTARVASIVIIEIAFCGSVMVYQYVKGKAFYIKKYWKYAICFSIPLIPHYLSGMILNQGDRIMLKSIIGETSVALYSVAYNLGMLIQIFTNSLNTAFTPWMYTSIRDKKIDDIKNVFNMLLLLIAVLIWLLMAFAPEIIKIFAAKEYYEAIYVIPPISASVFFIFMYVLFSNLEFYYEKNKFIMIASTITAVLNIILNAIFIPIIGYIAAGYTTLVSYIIYCFMHFVFCRNICNSKLEGAKIYDKTFLSTISLAMILSVLFFAIIYRCIYVRYVCILIIIVTIIIKRKYFYNNLQMLKNK